MSETLAPVKPKILHETWDIGGRAPHPRVAKISAEERGELKYYHAGLRDFNMYTPDNNFRIIISNYFFVSDVLEVTDYLDKEIDDGNTAITHATPDQIEEYKSRTMTREDIVQEVRTSMEEELKEKLTREILAKYNIQPEVSPVPGAAATPTITSTVSSETMKAIMQKANLAAPEESKK